VREGRREKAGNGRQVQARKEKPAGLGPAGWDIRNARAWALALNPTRTASG
jgi:hypothetical protein